MPISLLCAEASAAGPPGIPGMASADGPMPGTALEAWYNNPRKKDTFGKKSKKEC